MYKSFTVHEFDVLICNEDYKDSARYAYLPKKHFDELMTYAKEFKVSDEETDALEFVKIGYRKGVGDTISISNYVGMIELPSGFQIEVLPKIEFVGDNEEDRTRTVFLKMLRSLKDFEGKAFSGAFLKADRMNLYEVLISMYIKETQTLVKHGLKSSYNSTEDNLKYYKGKLKVGSHIKANLVHKERFYVEYDEYTINRAENRIVKATLLKLMSLSRNDENVKEIRRLLTSFELVDTSIHYEKDFSMIKMDRSTKDYELLMVWSRIFLSNKSFTPFGGNTSSKSILFPMEKVFEAYVARSMKRLWEETGWDISAQDKGYHLFDAPRRFSLRPDIVARRDGKLVIMDTKWKRLYSNVNNYGISQVDMYQMYAYSQKYAEGSEKKPEVWLLYPQSEFSEQIGEKEFSSQDGVKVHVYFIDVDHIEKSLEDLRSKVETASDMVI